MRVYFQEGGEPPVTVRLPAFFAVFLVRRALRKKGKESMNFPWSKILRLCKQYKRCGGALRLFECIDGEDVFIIEI